MNWAEYDASLRRRDSFYEDPSRIGAGFRIREVTADARLSKPQW
jgi:hypothetical protein